MSGQKIASKKMCFLFYKIGMNRDEKLRFVFEVKWNVKVWATEYVGILACSLVQNWLFLMFYQSYQN